MGDRDRPSIYLFDGSSVQLVKGLRRHFLLGMQFKVGSDLSYMAQILQEAQIELYHFCGKRLII
jgi:hypothetical protein